MEPQDWWQDPQLHHGRVGKSAGNLGNHLSTNCVTRSLQDNVPCRRLVGNPLRFRQLSEVRLYRRPSAMRTFTKKIACNRKKGKGNISPCWTWGEGGEIFGELDDSPRSPKLPQNILKAVGGLAVSFKSLFKIITRIKENGIVTFSKRSIDTTAVFVC